MSRNIFRIAAGTILLLLIPLIAGWPWTSFDFVLMGTLIFGAGLSYELLSKKVVKKHRMYLALVLLAAFLLVWAELAVGVFGTPFAGN